MDEELIERGEIVGMLFTIADIARSLSRIEGLLGGGDENGEEATDEG